MYIFVNHIYSLNNLSIFVVDLLVKIYTTKNFE